MPCSCESRNPLSSQVISNAEKFGKQHKDVLRGRNPLSSQVISNSVGFPPFSGQLEGVLS